MGRKLSEARSVTRRVIRKTPLSEAERSLLRAARYEGSPHHKRNPGDFGLTPPSAPRLHKTLCDEAGISERRVAAWLFQRAVDRGLVSETTTGEGFPKHLWAVDEEGRVFEAMYGGTHTGYYHGYPIRRDDPLFEEVLNAWKED